MWDGSNDVDGGPAGEPLWPEQVAAIMAGTVAGMLGVTLRLSGDQRDNLRFATEGAVQQVAERVASLLGKEGASGGRPPEVPTAALEPAAIAGAIADAIEDAALNLQEAELQSAIARDMGALRSGFEESVAALAASGAEGGASDERATPPEHGVRVFVIDGYAGAEPREGQTDAAGLSVRVGSYTDLRPVGESLRGAVRLELTADGSASWEDVTILLEHVLESLRQGGADYPPDADRTGEIRRLPEVR